MKKIIFTLLVLCALSLNAQDLFVGTYNIRNKNSSDSIKGNVWQKRSQVICDLINFEQPQIFGAQEVLYEQLNDMLLLLDNYDYVGVGRDDGKTKGEYSAIFYKKDRLKKLDSGHFWLNETPNKPVKGWDAACVRICTWAEFEDKTTKLRFYFFTLHMDHVGVIARKESAKLIIKKIKEINTKALPVVVTGDFNVDQNNEIYSIFTNSGILKDSYTSAKQRFCENGTFNSFSSDLKTDGRIDHIFVSPIFEVNNYAVLTDGYWTENKQISDNIQGNDAPKEISFKQYTKRTPSDHYPVFVKLHL